MEFFNSAVGVLQTLVVALGAGLGIWGVINLLEGYGQDNPASNTAEWFLRSSRWRRVRCFLRWSGLEHLRRRPAQRSF